MREFVIVIVGEYEKEKDLKRLKKRGVKLDISTKQ